MDNISDILSSLSAEDIESLKETAQSIFGNSQSNASENINSNSDKNTDITNMLNPEMFLQLSKIISAMNQDGGKRAKLLEALKPNLSEKRRKKTDEAIQIIKLLDILPLLNELQNRDD